MDTGLHEVPERVDSDVGIPLSQRIRQRLRSAGVRFHANDNIADYLREGEIGRAASAHAAFSRDRCRR
jgi:GTP cyclohydrolase I